MNQATSPAVDNPKLLFTVELPREAFRTSIFERERVANAGSTTHEDKPTGWTVWSIAGTWVGLSAPNAPTALAVIALTEEQHSLLVRALSEGMPAKDLPDYLWHMARVCGFDSKPLALLGSETADKVRALGATPGPTQATLPVGAAVRYHSGYLCRFPAAEQKRMVDRVGVVCGYRMGAHEPIVEFPAAGRRKALRLFEVHAVRLQALAAETPAIPAAPAAHPF